MIKLKIDAHVIEVSGHGGYAPPGYDIVCSAVSILVQTLLKSIESLNNDKIEYTLESGYFRMAWKNLSRESEILIDSFFIGMCGIMEAYPDYVSLSGE